MTVTWTVEPSAHGDGKWFVSEGPTQVSVFAAPGVRLPLASRTSLAACDGWRCSVWLVADDPTIDLDLPCSTEPVATAMVCAQLPEDLRERVRDVMVEQLAIALRFGDGEVDGLLIDDTVHARQATAVWIIEELREAFPAEAWELPRPSLLLTAIPDTYDGLIAMLPRPRERGDTACEAELTEGLGARQLLKLLSIVILRRVGAAFEGMGWMQHHHQHGGAVCPPQTDTFDVPRRDRLARVP